MKKQRGTPVGAASLDVGAGEGSGARSAASSELPPQAAAMNAAPTSIPMPRRRCFHDSLGTFMALPH